MVDVNLRKMTAADVIRQAVIASGKTQEEIEAEAGLRPGSLDQYQSRRDPHWPNILHLPALSMVLGTDLLIRWQEEQFIFKCLQHEPETLKPAELLRELVDAMSAMGDVAASARAALADDHEIDRPEAMAIRREAMELVASMFRIINGVAGRV